MIPLASGVISEADVKGEFYEPITMEHSARSSDEEITVFKNSGGAHLDLMNTKYIAQAIGGNG